jgi:hypothetical protein
MHALGCWAQTYDQRIAETTAKVDAVVKKGPFHDTWDSLVRFEVQHAFANEWSPRNMYIQGSKVFQHDVQA